MDGVTLIQAARALGLKSRLDGSRLEIKGPKSRAAIAKRLLDHKAVIIAALRAAHVPDWSRDARDHFLERLGIADDLELDTAPGSPAWETAVREARRVEAGVPPAAWTRGASVIDCALSAFDRVGVPLAVSDDATTAPPSPGAISCSMCGRTRWWRPAADPAEPGVAPSPASGWTCGHCHPPARPDAAIRCQTEGFT